VIGIVFIKVYDVMS